MFIIDGESVFEESGIYGNGMYFSGFFKCFMNERTMDMLEEKLREERYPNIEMNKDARLCDYRGKNWKDV